MKFLKTYEKYLLDRTSYDIEYGYGLDMFFISDVLKYLKIQYDYFSPLEILKTAYNVNTIDFIKEILMNKRVIFTSKNAIKNDPSVNGIIVDVIDFYFYKMDSYLKVKVNYNDNVDEYLMCIDNIVSIYDYDADEKPLHKEVKLKKQAEKFNI